MNIEHFVQYENNRKDTYQILAACHQQPDEDTIQKKAALVTVLGDVCSEAVKHITLKMYETTAEQLAIDHAKLFVGPFKLLAPPYGSVYLEGGRKVMGESTLDAERRYRTAGLKLSRQVKEAPDHIAIELEFMYYLIFEEIEAINRSDYQSAMGFLKAQQAFLQDHLGAWTPAFAKKVEENAETDFYRNLAKVLRAFIVCDLNNISDVSIATLDSLSALA